MILVFDLDDTLYDEFSYVKSSFKAVASYLSGKLKVNEDKIYIELMEILAKEGRGKIFNIYLEKYGLFSKKEVLSCLHVYRSNYPEIELYSEAKRCLIRFKNYPKYLVTDGNKRVQTTKIKALNLTPVFKRTLPTHNFGVRRAKPSTYVFHKILNWEKANPSDLVYIGDNPSKDFVNLKKEGFHTIRVLTGLYKNVRLSEQYEAENTISSLDELTIDFVNRLQAEK